MKDDLKRAVLAIVPSNRLLLTDSERAYASMDSSTNLLPQMPQAVIQVASAEELREVALTLLAHRQPFVVRGAGTGKSGGAIPLGNAVVVDISAANRIIQIDKQNLLAEVEPGVVLADLQKAASVAGLFYPPDPASLKRCTIGGNVAENAAGPSTLKYGSTKDYLLGGQAVLGTGEVIDFGKRCPKGVAGYDLASLLCGSEGTLAVFTKFTLRLLPLPKDHSCAMFYFSSDEQALDAISSVLSQGHLPKVLEFIDEISLQAAQKAGYFKEAPKNFPSALMIECDASYPGGARHQLELIIKSIPQVCHVMWARDEAHAQELRRMRNALSEACSSFLGHKISEDVAVPLGCLRKFAKAAHKLCEDEELRVAFFGHGGDGNLHVQILFGDEKLRVKAEKIRHKILHLVLDLGGTLTAEHGIGLQKKSYLPLEQSRAVIALQKRIKAAFDPHNLLNPGKIFD